MATIEFTHEYELVTCGAEGCDQTFGMHRRFYDLTHRTGQTWYCPKGHPRAWRGRTTEQKLKDAEAEKVHLHDQLRAAVAEAEKRRQQLLRDRQRYAAGVCPCCNRSFPGLARHIASKHPDYDAREIDRLEFRCSCGAEYETFKGLRIHQGHQRGADWTTAAGWRQHLTVVA